MPIGQLPNGQKFVAFHNNGKQWDHDSRTMKVVDPTEAKLYSFANYSEHTVKETDVNGKTRTWKTSEHYFHGQKYTGLARKKFYENTKGKSANAARAHGGGQFADYYNALQSLDALKQAGHDTRGIKQATMQLDAELARIDSTKMSRHHRQRATDDALNQYKQTLNNLKQNNPAMATIIDDNSFNPATDWDPPQGRAKDVMLDAIRMKYYDNADVRELLDATGDLAIIEDTAGAAYQDDTWGCGYDGDGDNLLGVALMQIRAEERMYREYRANNDLGSQGQIPGHVINEIQIKAEREANQIQAKAKAGLTQLGPRGVVDEKGLSPKDPNNKKKGVLLQDAQDKNLKIYDGAPLNVLSDINNNLPLKDKNKQQTPNPVPRREGKNKDGTKLIADRQSAKPKISKKDLYQAISDNLSNKAGAANWTITRLNRQPDKSQPANMIYLGKGTNRNMVNLDMNTGIIQAKVMNKDSTDMMCVAAKAYQEEMQKANPDSPATTFKVVADSKEAAQKLLDSVKGTGVEISGVEIKGVSPKECQQMFDEFKKPDQPSTKNKAAI